MPIPYSLEIVIDIQGTDSNRILGRSHFTKHRIFSEVKSQVHFLTLGKRPSSPLIRFKISVTRLSPRFMDFDNMISSLKPAIDGLRLAKIIKDDSWEFIKGIEVNQIKSKEKKLVIQVTETVAA